MSNSKNFLLLLFLVTLIPISARSSKDLSKKPYFKFGPKFGLEINVSNDYQASSSQFSDELTENYQFGGFMQFGKKLYLQPEFMYSVINTTNDQNVLTSYEFYRLPVHIGLKFFDIGLLSLHITGGAVYTLNSRDALSFEKERINYQVGMGVNIFDFITTDLRYTFQNNAGISQQMDYFFTQEGIINFTVGLKL